ncbi:asparagine synthetase domain-containing protein 1 [Aplysia californica]|uniref:Asparagine synthetase domain-containing protein 1 n=1 Tax=Aplysia californica TaxID=6500 RepID=A0ABM0JNP2_APLCA|nr:asparagine synthetase domain-containing protein 1 [Aplysia californica]
MCGICFICGPDEDGYFKQGSNDPVRADGLTDELLRNRGPDVSRRHFLTLREGLQGCMQGCVLHLRGQLTPQPVTDDDGNALLWNGEIFGGIPVEKEENDTEILFKALTGCSSEAELLSTLQAVKGPWGFIFWQASKKILWFGRDVFGRRSLLWHLPSCPQDHLILSSVALGDERFSEIPSVGIFSLDFSCPAGTTEKSPPSLTLYPWQDCVWPGTTSLVAKTEQARLEEILFSKHPCSIPVSINHSGFLTSWIPSMNPSIPSDGLQTEVESSLDKRKIEKCFQLQDGRDCTEKSSESCPEQVLADIMKANSDLDRLSDELINKLEEAVRTRVCNIPEDFHTENNGGNLPPEVTVSKAKVAILFSGGLDSSVLAALADRCVPPEEPIDLLNVAFELPARKSKPQQAKKPPKKTKAERAANRKQKEHERNQAVQCNVEQDDGSGERLEKETSASNCYIPNDLCSNRNEDPGVLCQFSSVSVHDDMSGVSSVGAGDVCVAPEQTIRPESRRSVPEGVINSCAGADKKLETHSSAVVAGCETGYSDTGKVPSQSSFDVPDRQTGRLAFSELNPRRRWNFIEIDVTQSELLQLRQDHIRRLIYPLQTVLDDSIGCAVWFASRGHGRLASDQGQPICSRARVLLCGMAADEQFAGYSRHRATFNKFGWEGLVKELQEEMWRISARNLGRDDRIITDHGKESRFPFLDEMFTRFVSNIPVHQRADLLLPRGIGEKVLLRIAAQKLGLIKTSCQPKRAIQFGSRIAKLDNSKEKGSDVCGRLS